MEENDYKERDQNDEEGNEEEGEGEGDGRGGGSSRRREVCRRLQPPADTSTKGFEP